MEGTAVSPDVRPVVDTALFSFLHERAASLPDAAELLREIERVAAAGGKRLRPAFCVWGYRAGGGLDDPAIARVAAALELVHTFAIVHDDVMDRSPSRRGEPSSYRRLADRGNVREAERFGSSAAILAGDLALALADELWWSAPFPAELLVSAARIYHEMRSEVIGGQYLDLLAAARGAATPDEARRITVLKSGRYTVERPLQIGARLASADPVTRAVLAAYGAPLGQAFQLRDDVLGAFGDPAVTGKDVDGDLREGKQTLLVALARERATPAQREVLATALGTPMEPAAAEAVRDVLRETGALDAVLREIDELVTAARDALDPGVLPVHVCDALDALAEEVGARPR